MANLSVSGSYVQKFRVFGITISQKKGSFAFAFPVPMLASGDVKPFVYSRGVGPFLITARLDGADIVVSASLYGILSQTLGKVRQITKPAKFSAQLDKANHLEGVIALVVDAPVAEIGATVPTI